MQKKLLGYCSVDSGLIMISDPCYILHKGTVPPPLGENWLDFCNRLSKAEAKTPDNPHWAVPHELGHEGLAIVSGMFGGDGTYPVYGYYKDGEVQLRKLTIEFS